VRGIQEDEEALVVGCVRLVGVKDRVHLTHTPQVYHMDVDLLGNRGWTQGVVYVVPLWPGTAVYIQVSTKEE